MNELKLYRLKLNISQKEAANLLSVSERTYQRYETEDYLSNKKAKILINELSRKTLLDEDHGILMLDSIETIVPPILKKYGIKTCYLFGSYARNEARENSDVDLLVDTDITGFAYLKIVEEIRVALSKRIDMIRICDLNEKGLEFITTILKEGIKII